jgi:NAD(P)-dependent dehydrogenase (short-subunit alcohol dehydrogenase family)
MTETRSLALAGAPAGTRVTTFVADVSDEAQVLAFRDAVSTDLATDHINLLFNNAGIGGGGSMIVDDRADWDRTFAIDWGGVYFGTRAFLPMLLAADEGHVINTSSVNGLWASIGPTTPHTAYSAAKFAIRGFTEALITDFRVNAPHLRASVVMPGHIGTSIAVNSRKIQADNESDEINATEIAQARARIASTGRDVSALSDDQLRATIEERSRRFLEEAPTTAARAATIILEGVKADRWRILVGADAEVLDKLVRKSPESAYDIDFYDGFAKEVGWRLGR